MERRYWWEHGNAKKKSKIVGREAFVDTVGIKSADFKGKFAAFRTA